MITKKLLAKKRLKRKVILLPIFPFIWFYYWIKYLLVPKIKRRGIKGIVGDTGKGKSLSVSIITKELSEKYGLPVYSNSDFAPHVTKFDIHEYFGNYEKLKQLPPCILVLDEISREFNKRRNKERNYNEVFSPLIEQVMTHRHDGITHVYFIAQKINRMDGALIDLIQSYHLVTSRNNPSLTAWLRDPKIKPIFRPLSIKYFTLKPEEIDMPDIKKYVNKRKKEIQYKPRKPDKIIVPLSHLAEYKTHAFKSTAHLKNDKEKETPKK